MPGYEREREREREREVEDYMCRHVMDILCL